MGAETKSEPTPAPEAKQDNTTRNVLIVLGVLVVTVILCAVCIFVVIPALTFTAISSGVDEIAREIEESEEIDLPSYADSYAIGEYVTVGDVSWKVDNVTNYGDTLPSSSDFWDDVTTEGVSYIRIELTVRNDGSDEINLWNDIKIVDDSGNSYSTSSYSYYNLEDDEQSMSFESINPGLKKSFVEVYEVDEDAAGLKLEVTDLGLFATEKMYIDLEI